MTVACPAEGDDWGDVLVVLDLAPWGRCYDDVELLPRSRAHGVDAVGQHRKAAEVVVADTQEEVG